MKKKIAWVTDSTAYITEELKNNPDVFMIPLSIIFGERVYEDGMTINEETLYEKIREYDVLPTTSQPSIGRFVELYERLRDQYEKVIMIHVSEQLSGTASASKQAADLAGIDYVLIDSLSVSYGITYLLETGILLHKQGNTVEDIVSYLKATIPTLENYILVGSLSQLHKGGRMSSSQFLLGTLLNIKPILQIQGGTIHVYDKVRSGKKAAKRILEECQHSIAANGVEKVAVLHGNRREDAEEWKNQLLTIFPYLTIDVAPITSVVSVHAGEGTLAVLWYNRTAR
ncbi:DegV family protein [Bacillus sp. 165]|uniref:DegV family protein n=1 Tax=Bacillus sp. 165 TaxID=1529117 RepID=UPI001ADA9C10|nr:DegV family protein [Bacillus sp. 165]MBO9128765.1 DegV family protein [Bacillus sp. 165]